MKRSSVNCTCTLAIYYRGSFKEYLLYCTVPLTATQFALIPQVIMEEHKLLALHESLSKLRKSAGLGVNSQYSWQKNGDPAANSLITTTETGEQVRTDGLPVNMLYNNFVKSGSYDPKDQRGAHGDGRKIKRDFSDCNNTHVVSSPSSSDSEEDSSAKKKAKKEKRKSEKKAAKKAAKLEAKRQAKLEEKKRAKKEEKKRKLEEAGKQQSSKDDDEVERPKKKSKKSKDKGGNETKRKDKSEKSKEKKAKKSKRKD